MVAEAAALFDRHLRAPFLAVRDDLQHRTFGGFRLPCASLQTWAGRFCVMQPGLWDSDIAWISVDDDQTYLRFEDMFRRSGVARQMESVIDHIDALRVYSAYFVVRSRGNGTNFHSDFVRDIGCNAFTLMTPLADYCAPDFQLLYRDLDGATRQHRYKHGEALCFGSDFEHSTEPGHAREADGGMRL